MKATFIGGIIFIVFGSIYIYISRSAKNIEKDTALPEGQQLLEVKLYDSIVRLNENVIGTLLIALGFVAIWISLDSKVSAS